MRSNVKYRTIFGVCAFVTYASAVHGADFSAFTFQGHTGYVQQTADGGGTIHVLPILKITTAEDLPLGMQVVFGLQPFPLVGNAAVELKIQALTQILGHAPSAQELQKYGMDAPIGSELEVRMLVAGNLASDEKFPLGMLAAQNTYEVWYKGNDENCKKAIRNGTFRIDASFKFPFNTFSGLNVNIEEQAVTAARVQAFKDIAQESSDTQGGFLFIKWGEKTFDRVVKGGITSQATEDFKKSIQIDMTDPTPEMRAHLDRLLQLDEIDSRTFIAGHREAARTAREQGKAQVADLHDSYVDSVVSKNASAQVDTAKAVAALSDGDIAGFISAGVAFESQQGSGNYSYRASNQMNLSSTRKEEFKELIVQSSRVAVIFTQSSWPQAANLFQARLQAQISNLTGGPILNVAQAKQVLALGIGAADESIVKGGLLAGAPADDPASLALAAKKDSTAIVKMLLAYSDSVKPITGSGLDAIAWAVKNKNAEVLSLLIKKGAGTKRVYTDVMESEFKGHSLLTLALSEDDPDPVIVDLLLSTKQVPLDIRDKLGKSALAYAIQSKNFELVGRLLRAGAKTTKIERDTNDAEYDVFTTAVNSIDDKDDRQKMVLELLRGGAPYDTWRDPVLQVPLDDWARTENMDLVRLAILKKSGPADEFRIEAQELITHCLDSLSSGDFQTSELERIDEMLKMGVRASSRADSTENYSLLAYSIDAECSLPVQKLLIAYGAEINEANSSRSPLHMAVSQNNTELVSYLLSKGAKPTFKDKSGKKPIDYIRADDSEEIRKLLQE